MKLLAYLVLLGFPVALGGCYSVRLEPIPSVPADPLPITARIAIPADTAGYTYDVRSFAAGIGNRWRILVGEALVQYAEAYLRPVFPEGSDVSISILIESFDVHDFEAHISSRFAVQRGDDELFDKRYLANGQGYFARTAWGGAFAMKSSMRSSTNEALRSLFEQFLGDVDANYDAWRVDDATLPAERSGPPVDSLSR